MTKYSRTSFWAALFAGLLFLCHPLQTQAVTYIWQRAASLSTLFYLLTLLFYMRARKKHNAVLYTLSFLAFAVGCLTKEIIFTAPVTVLFYEQFFARHRDQPFSKQAKILMLAGGFLLMAIIPVKGFLTGELSAFYWKRHFYNGAWTANGWEYLLTQCHVLLVYVRLLFYPVSQNFDHDIPIAKTPWEWPVLGGLSVLLILFVLVVFGYKRNRVFSFGILWFLVALSVESSVIPLRDVIFEHRLYLPMAGFAVALFAFNQSLMKERTQLLRAVTVVIMIPLALMTYHRNKVWANEISLWTDVVQKSPNKARGYTNLGIAYLHEGEYKAAAVTLKKALAINPQDALSLMNLGIVNKRRGKEPVKGLFLKAIYLEPTLYEARLNLAAEYAAEENYQYSFKHYQHLIEFFPDFALSYINLGNLHFRTGNMEAAQTAYEKAQQVNPDLLQPYELLGNIQAALGENEKAKASYHQALERGYRSADVLTNLSVLANREGEYETGLKFAQEAIAMDSQGFQAYNQAGIAYSGLKDFKTAERIFHSMIQLRPDSDIPYLNLAKLFQRRGRISEALGFLEKAVELNPDNEQAVYELIHLYESAGNSEKAEFYRKG